MNSKSLKEIIERAKKFINKEELKSKDGCSHHPDYNLPGSILVTIFSGSLGLPLVVAACIHKIQKSKLKYQIKSIDEALSLKDEQSVV